MAKKKKVIKRKTAKNKVARKPVKKATRRAKAKVKAKVRKAKVILKPSVKKLGKEVGIITHYFPKVRAAVIKLKAPLAVGDTLKFKGHTTDFTQVINSMQVDHVPIQTAKKGQEIGLLVNSRVRQHDVVLKK